MPNIAETIALELGCELDVKKQPDAEEQLLAERQEAGQPRGSACRAPRS